MAASSRGRGRGRGGFGQGGGRNYKPGELELLKDPDYDRSKPQPDPLFPAYHPTPPKPLSKTEKRQVQHFLAFRKRVHDGPHYTILDEEHQVGKPKRKAAAVFDPFEGMPTYTHRYIKRRRTLPKLDDRSYVLKFFPKELWSTIDPKNHPASGPQGMNVSANRRKKQQDLTDLENAVAKGEREEVNADEDEEKGEATLDDDFEEEEDDDAGDDYNAEQYFDGNQDEAGEEIEADEGDGGGDFY